MTVGQSIGCYLADFVSAVLLCLGVIGVGFDARKQGWRDKLANTAVLPARRAAGKPVVFEKL